MGLSFNKKVPLGKNVSVNLSKSGVSFSLKLPGFGSLNLRNGKLTFSGGKAGFRLRETLNKKPKAQKEEPNDGALAEEPKAEEGK